MMLPKNRNINILVLSWAIVSTLILVCWWLWSRSKECPYVWHGGSPSIDGSCWCGKDKYCLCTPSLAIDALIEIEEEDGKKLVLVHRRDPPKDLFAIPGGFVDVGETVEAATIREVKEETNLDLYHLEQFRVYSDPTRDKRRHTVSSVFVCKARPPFHIKTGDDAKSVQLVPIKELLTKEYAFDHFQILSDYLGVYHKDLQ